MKHALISTSIFLILTFAAISGAFGFPWECEDAEGNKICYQLFGQEQLETDFVFGTRFRFTNNSAEIVFIPTKTEPEFCGFLGQTNVGSGNLDVDVCWIDSIKVLPDFVIR